MSLFLHFSLPRPFFVFRHLLGTTQYYQEMSYIVFEHMGLRNRHFDDLNFETLMDRALLRERQDEDGKIGRGMRGGIEEAAQSLLEARLFVSKCQDQDEKPVQGLQGRLERLAQKVKVRDD